MNSYARISLAALAVAAIMPAFAKPGSFSPARSSYSAPARVAPRPAPVPQRPAVAPQPKVINKTVNNTTVIRETRVIRPAAPAQSSGSGFFSNMAASAVGAVGGSMLGNWLSRPSEPAPVQQAPVQQPQLAPAVEHAQPACDATIYNCEKKVKQ